MVDNSNVRLSAPWITYYRQVETLFKDDPAVKVSYDDEMKLIKLFVEGQDKADALTQLLPAQKAFGNVCVTISVIPANQPTKKVDLLKKAFDGNPIFAYASTIEDVMTNPISYVVFEPVVAQYWNDNLHDPHGLVSTLYEDLAREIFGEEGGIFFSTSLKEPMAIG